MIQKNSKILLKQSSSQPNQKPMSTRAIKKRKCSAESWEATKSDSVEFLFENQTNREEQLRKRGHRHAVVCDKKADDVKNLVLHAHSKQSESALQSFALRHGIYQVPTTKISVEKPSSVVDAAVIKQNIVSDVQPNNIPAAESNIDKQAQLRSALVPLLSALLKTVNDNKHAQSDESNLTQIPHYSYDDQGYIIFSKGLVVNDRYQLLSPLGQGTFSKVFMASDVQQPGTFRAIKIIKNSKRYQLAASGEINILQHIRDNSINHAPVIHLIEHSAFHAHPVLIFPLYGRTLHRFAADNHFVPLPDYHILDIVKQLCHATAYVHSLGIIIADLKPENIVLVDDRTVVQTGKDGRMMNVLLNTRIKIIDFGSAVVGTKCFHNHLIQTRHYRAPEVMLRMGWSFSVDIWSIGCTIVELVSGKILFNTHDTIDHLNQISKCIGNIPVAILEAVSPSVSGGVFNIDGSVVMTNAKSSSIQCGCLESYFTVRQLLFYKLTTKMLMWNPFERVSALSCSEALDRLCARNARDVQTNSSCDQTCVVKRPESASKTNREKQCSNLSMAQINIASHLNRDNEQKHTIENTCENICKIEYSKDKL